jgi:cold shock protein
VLLTRRHGGALSSKGITQTGTISYFSDERGFGFISRAGMERDVFYHISGIANRVGRQVLSVGDVVTFDLAENERGPIAVNVTLV